jgi:zinc ribbon protein
MIIYGHHQRKTDVATGEFDCPQCQTQRTFKHKRVDRYFTLFFIPLFPIGRLGEYVECQTCLRTYRTDVLNEPAARAVTPVSIKSIEAQPAHLRPATPNSAGRAGLLAVVGAAMFLCAVVSGLLMTAAQLTDVSGPSHNLRGFIGVLVVCPLPLAMLGMALLAGGFFLAWKSRAKARADA